MKTWWARLGDELIPACEESTKLLRRLAPGEGLQLNAIRVRSLDWHKMYFACCREIGRNRDPQRDEDSIDGELRIRAGHYEVIFVDGHEVRYPKRIAFDKLTADQWAQLWPSLDAAMLDGFGFDFEEWKYSGRVRQDEQEAA
jgi:hypothetical protein